jgi:RNA polymerase-binding transcription factor DksA
MTTRQIEYFEGLLEQERDHAIEIHEEARVSAIRRAIDQLHTDPEHYGICIECGRPIDTDRLRIVPTTRYCEDDAELRSMAVAGGAW